MAAVKNSIGYERDNSARQRILMHGLDPVTLPMLMSMQEKATIQAVHSADSTATCPPPSKSKR